MLRVFVWFHFVCIERLALQQTPIHLLHWDSHCMCQCFWWLRFIGWLIEEQQYVWETPVRQALTGQRSRELKLVHLLGAASRLKNSSMPNKSTRGNSSRQP